MIIKDKDDPTRVRIALDPAVVQSVITLQANQLELKDQVLAALRAHCELIEKQASSAGQELQHREEELRSAKDMLRLRDNDLQQLWEDFQQTTSDLQKELNKVQQELDAREAEYQEELSGAQFECGVHVQEEVKLQRQLQESTQTVQNMQVQLDDALFRAEHLETILNIRTSDAEEEKKATTYGLERELQDFQRERRMNLRPEGPPLFTSSLPSSTSPRYENIPAGSIRPLFAPRERHLPSANNKAGEHSVPRALVLEDEEPDLPSLMDLGDDGPPSSLVQKLKKLLSKERHLYVAKDEFVWEQYPHGGYIIRSYPAFINSGWEHLPAGLVNTVELLVTSEESGLWVYAGTFRISSRWEYVAGGKVGPVPDATRDHLIAEVGLHDGEGVGIPATKRWAAGEIDVIKVALARAGYSQDVHEIVRAELGEEAVPVEDGPTAATEANGSAKAD